MAVVRRPPFVTGCWQDVTAPHHVDLCKGLLELSLHATWIPLE